MLSEIDKEGEVLMLNIDTVSQTRVLMVGFPCLFLVL